MTTHKIFIGVGHGGADPGAVCGNIVESHCNLMVALTLEQELKRHGVQVLLSRYGDEPDKLSDEIAECNAYKPDLAIEIHTNAGGGSGFEVYHQVTDNWARYRLSVRMAQLLQKEVQKYQKVKPRDIKAGSSFAWLAQVQAPAVLCENFFVDGPNAHVYAQQDNLKALAKAYARAVLEYCGIAYHEQQEGYWFSIIEPGWHVKHIKVQGILQHGHIYVPVRKWMEYFDRGVYYDAATKESIIYPSQYFSHADFATGKVKLQDICPEEYLTDEEKRDYGYEEILFDDELLP